jgi:uncharacterized membrane protein YcaP (DUF421 family)
MDLGGMFMYEWLEITLRTILAVVVLFLLTKLLGKRQISQLSLFEYITGISIGNLASYLSLDTDKSWFLGILAMAVWVTISLLIGIFELKSKKLRDMIDGKGRILVEHGKVLEDNLKKEKLTSDELMEQLRQKNAFKLKDVEFAIMEPNGQVSVLLKKENQPLTPKDIGLRMAPEYVPQMVIMDGEIMDEALFKEGYTRRWLHTELEKIGVTQQNVFIAQTDGMGGLYVDLYDDKIQVPKLQEKPAVLATIKKCEADLELFGLTTKNKAAKDMYAQCAAQLENLIIEVKPFLRE